MKQNNIFQVSILHLITYDEKIYDLYSIFDNLTIDENLFSPGLNGSINIVDSNGFLESFPLIGEEQIYVKFISKNGYTYDQYFNVYNISNIKYNDGDKTNKTYTIHFISNVVEKNIGNKYSISSLEFNTETIVTDIFNNKLQTSIECEPSNTSLSISTPYWKPFKIINYLSALSNDVNGYGDYILYENRNGWHWKTIRSLIAADITYSFIQETNVAVNNSSNNDVTIRNISCSQLYDTIDGANEGLYAASSTIYSIVNKSIENFALVIDSEKNDSAVRLNEFSRHYSRGRKYNHPWLEDIIDGEKLLGQNEFYSNLNSPIGSHIIKSNEPNSSRYTNEHDITLLARQFDASINQMEVSIEIDGNSNITVGECINLIIPSFNKVENNLDRIFSGKYLIVQVKHILTNDVYVTHLVVIKDSYIEELVKREESVKPKLKRKSSSNAIIASNRG
jgi:hypothetical protein